MNFRSMKSSRHRWVQVILLSLALLILFLFRFKPSGTHERQGSEPPTGYAPPNSGKTAHSPLTVRGRVLDRATKSPLPGAWITFPHRKLAKRVETDPQGSFELVVDELPQRILCTYLRGNRGPELDGRLSFDLSGSLSGIVERDIELDVLRSVTVQGQVVFASGAPAKGSLILLLGPTSTPEDASDELWAGPTDESGCYFFKQLLPVDSFILCVQGSSIRHVSKTLVVRQDLAAQKFVENFVVDTAPKLTGVLRDPSGKPLANTFLLMRTKLARGEGRVRFDTTYLQTDAQGRFECPVPEEGEVSLVATHPLYQVTAANLGKPLQAGDMTRDLQFSSVRSGSHVSTRVVNEIGAGIKGAEITLTPPSKAEDLEREVRFLSDETGAIDFILEPEKTYFLSISHRDYPEPLELTISTRSISTQPYVLRRRR